MKSMVSTSSLWNEPAAIEPVPSKATKYISSNRVAKPTSSNLLPGAIADCRAALRLNCSKDDLTVVDGLGHLAEQGVGHRRRAPHRQAGVHARRLAAVVVDLGEDRHPVAVHGVGDAPVAGDDLAVEAVDQLLVRPVGGVGAVLLGDDQPCAAGRASDPFLPRNERRSPVTAMAMKIWRTRSARKLKKITESPGPIRPTARRRPGSTRWARLSCCPSRTMYLLFLEGG